MKIKKEFAEYNCETFVQDIRSDEVSWTFHKNDVSIGRLKKSRRR